MSESMERPSKMSSPSTETSSATGAPRAFDSSVPSVGAGNTGGAGRSSSSNRPGSALAPAATDNERLRQLVANHHQAAFRYAVRLCGSVADAEDIVQQSFLTAQQRLHQLRDWERAEGWLLAIVRTSFLKSIRRKRPVNAGSLELNVGEIPANTVESPIDEELLRQALADLSDEYRTVLLMFYFEDASYREIAEQLNLPIGTVMSRLSRAKSHLRAALMRRHDFHDRSSTKEAGDA